MWNLVSFVKRSKARRRVLEAVKDFKTPTEVSKELGIHRSSASRALIELEAKKLVACLTPKEKLGRLYQTTKKGKDVLNTLATKNQGPATTS